MKSLIANFSETGLALSLLLSLCALFVGCSSSPSVGDGERAIHNRIIEESESRIKLTKFEKTNGQSGEPMGFKIYAMDFQAEIEFADDCKWVTGFGGLEMGFRTLKVQTPMDMFEANLHAGFRVSKGQRAKISGIIQFAKKEKGWAVDSLQFTKAHVEGSEWGAAKRPQTEEEKRNQCENNLRQIGLAFKIFALNHNSQFPFNVGTNEGGAMEFCFRGTDGFDSNAFLMFQIMSNELSSTQLLHCPSDSGRWPATDFGQLRPAQLSYQIRSGRDVNADNPTEVLARCPIHGCTLLSDGTVPRR